MSKAFDFATSIEGSGGFDGLKLPTGSGTGQAGEMRFNTTTGQMEFWSSTSDTPQWRTITKAPVIFDVRYLVIGGGGGGGGFLEAAGGGAGGYRTNFGTGNISGGLSPVEAAITLSKNTPYTVTVGAGGTAGPNNGSAQSSTGGRGGDSTFATITSLGGGGGGVYSNIMPPTSQLPVGSGGGYPNGSSAGNGQAGTAGQGFRGGNKTFATHCANFSGSGGGGAGAAGGDRTACLDIPAGGDGLASSITGTSVYRAGGGGGAPYGTGLNGGAGGLGGGGAGGTGNTSSGIAGTAGTPNTGGGGGGAGSQGGTTGGAGGSGVVILRLSSEFTVTFSSGVTYTSNSVDDDTVYTITATSTASETVTFS
jgi:hypothetical protein